MTDVGPIPYRCDDRLLRLFRWADEANQDVRLGFVCDDVRRMAT